MVTNKAMRDAILMMALVVALGAAPAVAQAEPLGDALESVQSIEQKIFDADVAGVERELSDLRQQSGGVADETLQRKFQRSFEAMDFYLNNLDSASTSLTTFLRANTELYKVSVDAFGPGADTREYQLYQLRYLTKKLKYEVLDDDWPVLERETAEDLYSWWDKTRLDLVDGTLKSNLDVLQRELAFAVEARDAAKVLSIVERYQTVIPELETALVKTEAHREIFNERNYTYAAVAGGVLVLLLALWWWSRRRKR